MKGQTAVEYLMTYGWAILIILIVAGVLAYYGIFAPAGFLGPSSKGFTQINVLQPWDVDAAGNLKMQIENRVGQDIVITEVKAVLGTTGTPLTCGEDALHPYTTVPVTIVNAGTKFPQTGLMTLGCSGGIGTGTTGSSYTITVQVIYTVGGTQLTQTGTLSGSRS